MLTTRSNCKIKFMEYKIYVNIYGSSERKHLFLCSGYSVSLKAVIKNMPLRLQFTIFTMKIDILRIYCSILNFYLIAYKTLKYISLLTLI